MAKHYQKKQGIMDDETRRTLKNAIFKVLFAGNRKKKSKETILT